MSMSSRLKSALKDSAFKVEKTMNELPFCFEESQQSKHCYYSLRAGGKRLRPFLVLQTCASLGGNPEDALPAACSVEMIHTYSLVHDDLPGMDDDDIRRGKPTLHKICGIKGALFAADRLLLESFRTLMGTKRSEPRVRAMLKKLVTAAGTSFLVGGQFMDMYHPTRADHKWTRRMITGKTSAMIRVSMELGAMVSGISDGDLSLVSSIGDDTGWLFQLTDDILDVTGTSLEMGKAVSKDAGMGKWNPVNELGVHGARELARRNAASIVQRLDSLTGDWTMIRELVEYLPERRK